MALFPLGILSAAGAGGGAAGDYELIQTQILGSATPSVVFSNLGNFSSTYKHLQLRVVGRSEQSNVLTELAIRVNGVSSNSYSWHFLRGNGSSVSSAAGSTTNGMFLSQLSSPSAVSNNFGVGVIDILDPYSTTKNKTFRGLSGTPDPSLARISLYSGLYQSTDSITSLTLFSQDFSSNLVAGSRFSLYGIRG